MADTNPSQYAPNVYKAWGHLQTEINRNLPSVLAAIQRAEQGAYSRLQHKRRVRR